MNEKEIPYLKLYFKQSDGGRKVCCYGEKDADELFEKLVELMCRGRGYGMELCQMIIKGSKEGGE